MQVLAIMPIQKIAFNCKKDSYNENESFKDNLHRALQIAASKKHQQEKFQLNVSYK